ncbi:MAG: iron ABC transporter permease [Candidatus Lokiarchaeota archaeon]|nr:iron ABC transporter permease [Candidatus Lokiarchaeota archaeon]
MSETIRKIEKAFSTPTAGKIANGIILTVFFMIIIIPILYIFGYVFMNFGEINFRIFINPLSGNKRFLDMLTALGRSFLISSIVVIVDIIIGLPMALILARSEFKGKNLLDTLVDLPLAVPTAALGFSVYLFWGSSDGIAWIFGQTSLIPEGIIMIIMAHIIFTYPYIVRNLKVVILNVDKQLEVAAQSLGAQKFTVFRTITGPLMKEGLIAGAILAFTRSLGETGATLIVYGVTETAPIQIISLKTLGLFAPAAFLTMILVSIAILLLICIKILARKVGLPIDRVWVGPERFFSKKSVKYTRNIVIFTFFIGFVLIPATYIIPYLITHLTGNEGAIAQVFLQSDNKWATLWLSLMNSLTIALFATLITLVIGIPMALIIVRKKWGRINAILDTLVDLPLVIPSAALGFSVFLFWGTLGPFGVFGGIFTPGYLLILITHVVFTFPFMVRVLIAVLEGLEPGYEEAARTLGAPSFTTFRKVTLPLIKNGILAGCIMVFARSLGETGATVVVMGTIRTIPVMLVDWVESVDLPAAAFASMVLIILSFILILVLRYITLSEHQREVT